MYLIGFDFFQHFKDRSEYSEKINCDKYNCGGDECYFFFGGRTKL